MHLLTMQTKGLIINTSQGKRKKMFDTLYLALPTSSPCLSSSLHTPNHCPGRRSSKERVEKMRTVREAQRGLA